MRSNVLMVCGKSWRTLHSNVLIVCVESGYLIILSSASVVPSVFTTFTDQVCFINCGTI